MINGRGGRNLKLDRRDLPLTGVRQKQEEEDTIHTGRKTKSSQKSEIVITLTDGRGGRR